MQTKASERPVVIGGCPFRLSAVTSSRIGAGAGQGPLTGRLAHWFCVYSQDPSSARWWTASSPGRRVSQSAAVEVLLFWQVFARVVSAPLTVLVERFDLRVERSFNDRYSCQFAYLETDTDAYTLVRWDPATNVEVWASPRPDDHGAGDFPAGSGEFLRFLTLAALTGEDVVIPPRDARTRDKFMNTFCHSMSLATATSKLEAMF